MDEVELTGGVANAGKVTRAGTDVLRPSNPRSADVHRFLRALRAAGFTGASEPIGIDPDGRERLVFIAGDVPLPPYPAWAQTDDALASVATLMRGLHDAAAGFDPGATQWRSDLGDPRGGPVLCHNDVCLENVVFRDGAAIGFLDFDYVSPGRPEYDVARMAAMCGPVDDDLSAARLGWLPADRPRRVRLVTDTYGLGGKGRHDVLDILSESIARGGRFVQERVAAGDPGFVTMWEEMGGMERFDRRRAWWDHHRDDFAAALA